MNAEAPFAALIPELVCDDVAESVRQYTNAFGFRVRFKRPGFAFLEREGAQIMLVRGGKQRWRASPPAHPYGHGIDLRIAVADVAEVADDIEAAGLDVYEPLHEVWYTLGGERTGFSQLLVQDRDGYVLRFAQPIGKRLNVWDEADRDRASRDDR